MPDMSTPALEDPNVAAAEPAASAIDPADLVYPPTASQPPVAAPEIRPETVVAATFEAMTAKPRRTDSVDLHTVDGDGKPIVMKVSYAAIDGPTFDKISDTHPPTAEQARKGAQWGVSFSSALLEAVVTEPKLSYAQWEMLRKNPNWSGGEFGHLFNTALRVCSGGLDVSFTASG